MLLTNLTRTMNAIRFVLQQQNSLWMVIGQATPWSAPYSDTNPPPDSPSNSPIASPVCAIKATCQWVYEDDVNGSIQFIDANNVLRKFTAIADQATAISHPITNVLLQGTTSGSNLTNLDISTFRQIGFYSNLVPVTGHTSDTFLIPSNIASYGNMEALENSTPQPAITGDNYQLSFIYQF